VLRVFEYLCDNCKTITEDFRKDEAREIPLCCPECGAEARFIISAPRISLEGLTGDFPGAYDRWEKVRKQKQKQEEKKSYIED
jgi:putative FmdB family regulatory protein